MVLATQVKFHLCCLHEFGECLIYKKNLKKISRSSGRDLVVDSWNVGSSGDVHGCRKWQVLEERSEAVDRKLDLLVGELKRYGVSVAGKQETRWFERNVWPAADGYTCLHSEMPLTGKSETPKQEMKE